MASGINPRRDPTPPRRMSPLSAALEERLQESPVGIKRVSRETAWRHLPGDLYNTTGARRKCSPFRPAPRRIIGILPEKFFDPLALVGR